MSYMVLLLFIVSLNVSFVSLSSIPMWEYLSREEKLGRIFSILHHLSGVWCKEKAFSDCQRTLTLHGASALLQKDDHTLDLLDPYQRLGQDKIWKALMEPKYEMPQLKVKVVETEKSVLINKISEEKKH